ncbi:MAG: gamma-glutamyl-gamma-aminobutyrate hydrolase family protein [Deinococcus sp.]|nr:gamma-glutamyl-gamma-aminobutyrate hydrolase family protein [Deinococcus sp.]
MSRPVIGLTTRTLPTENPVGRYQFAVPEGYVRAIVAAGGLPLELPLVPGELAEEYLELVDGLLFTGGKDLSPMLYGEEPHQGLGEIDVARDEFEMSLARAALKRDLPLLGICRGIQTLNVAAGGTLYQDLPSQLPQSLKHEQKTDRQYTSHSVQIVPGSHLADMFGLSMKVNSHHHQAVKAVAPGFQVTARASDGVIEAIEMAGQRFMVGVQWHPEALVDDYPAHRRLFTEFVRAASDGAGN